MGAEERGASPRPTPVPAATRRRAFARVPRARKKFWTGWPASTRAGPEWSTCSATTPERSPRRGRPAVGSEGWSSRKVRDLIDAIVAAWRAASASCALFDPYRTLETHAIAHPNAYLFVVECGECDPSTCTGRTRQKPEFYWYVPFLCQPALCSSKQHDRSCLSANPISHTHALYSLRPLLIVSSSLYVTQRVSNVRQRGLGSQRRRVQLRGPDQLGDDRGPGHAGGRVRQSFRPVPPVRPV
jgi:hypothetical protein